MDNRKMDNRETESKVTGRKKIAVLFGGQSSEHIVSCMSAANVTAQIDTERYELVLIGITEEGHWVKAESVEDIKSVSYTHLDVYKRQFQIYLYQVK